MRHRLVQAALARIVGLYLKLALRTTRWTIDGLEYVLPHAAGRPVVVAFWHEFLPLMPIFWPMSRRLPGAVRSDIYALVSRHRDGQLIGQILTFFGLRLMHGSSNKGGVPALHGLAKILQSGDHVVITPDGPRGPRRQAAPGVAQVAALSGAPVLPCAAQTTRRMIMGSWDRMVLPLPFGRGVIVCGPTIPVPRDDWQPALQQIAAALTAAADRADRLCAA